MDSGIWLTGKDRGYRKSIGDMVIISNGQHESPNSRLFHRITSAGVGPVMRPSQEFCLTVADPYSRNSLCGLLPCTILA
jgi:hypothetical protein